MRVAFPNLAGERVPLGVDNHMSQEAKTVEELKTVEEQKTAEELKAPGDAESQENPKKDEERRSSPRLQCSGLAGIQKLPAAEKPCPAKILDLSVGGCLMALEKPVRLVIDEFVELIFCVNHIPFRVRGKVRVLRSETLVGFQLSQLSERARRQLEDLVRELFEHLKKLQREGIAHRPSQDDVEQPHIPVNPAIRGSASFHQIKPGELRPGGAISRPESQKRWF